MPTKRFVVTGRVQGVGFRFFTATSATRNGLYGFVRNQADGSVEVIASGEPRGLNVLHSELSRGPRSARVKQVSVEDCEFREQWDSFEIR